jgi:hypothetical protein
MSILSKWLRLSWADRLLLAQAACLLAAVHLGLRLLPFRMLRRGLDRLARTLPRPVAPAAGYAARLAWAVPAAGRRLLGADSCLAQALAARCLLRRQGLPGELRIGVAKDGADRLVAHAWVESGGQVVVGGSVGTLESYTPLPALEGSER